jgi:hypothetical protein
MLCGAGVALSLPWLETLAPRRARAQAAAAPRRYVSLYFPNGTAAYWRPSSTGTGDAWKLSPILEPLAPVKSKMLVLGNVANTAPFITDENPDGEKLEDSHPSLAASTWTATPPSWTSNGISVDQIIANDIAASPAATSIHSLQLGLSTQEFVVDILPAVHARSISWRSPNEPLYKVVNPQAVFDRLVATDGEPGDVEAERRRALRRSALDYIQESTISLQGKLGRADRARLDGFLSSVRSLETRLRPFVAAQARQTSCVTIPRPPAAYAIDSVPEDYDRGVHAGLMNDLIVMALACDRTRVVSHMLDDGRSMYEYRFLPRRAFTAAGSTESEGACGPYHVLQHMGDDDDQFATVGWWMCGQAAQLASKLAAVSEGEAGSLLDNTVVVFASGMNGGNHLPVDLPIAILGSGGGVLKQDTHLRFSAQRQLADVHLTIMRQVFGCSDSFFGRSNLVVNEILV